MILKLQSEKINIFLGRVKTGETVIKNMCISITQKMNSRKVDLIITFFFTVNATLGIKDYWKIAKKDISIVALTEEKFKPIINEFQ